MIAITYWQLFVFITILWVLIRIAVNVKSRYFSLKRELQLLLVYICIIVIARFVYFGFHLIDGKMDTLKLDPAMNTADMLSLIPFYFLSDRYSGWLMNILGNVAMFIPVGLVWPLCFRKLDSFWKAVMAGGGFSLFIELTQLLCFERHSDIDDLILNTTGVAIGAALFFAIHRRRHHADSSE